MAIKIEKKIIGVKMENDYYFSTVNKYAYLGIEQSIMNLNRESCNIVVLCIGSDLVLGDSLGPLTGTLLRKKGVKSFVYGTLNLPITAKEINYTKEYLRRTHPNSTVIAIDAAIGEKEDIGQIKVKNGSIKPGLGVKKNLEAVGDISIIGIVANKSNDNFKLFNGTRLNLIYKMADVVSDAIVRYVENISNNQVTYIAQLN